MPTAHVATYNSNLKGNVHISQRSQESHLIIFSPLLSSWHDTLWETTLITKKRITRRESCDMGCRSLCWLYLACKETNNSEHQTKKNIVCWARPASVKERHNYWYWIWGCPTRPTKHRSLHHQVGLHLGHSGQSCWEALPNWLKTQPFTRKKKAM